MIDTTATLPRKERERLQRREAMLEAARAVFAEKGYQNATLEEIASRAEFGKGTLYNYFDGGKEQILFSILDDVYDELSSVSEQIFKTGHGGSSFREKLHRYILSLIRYFISNRDLFAILIKEAHRLALTDGAEKQSYFRQQDERLAETLVPVIEQAVADGELKPLPPRAMAHMVQGNVNGYLMFVFCNCRDSAAADRVSPEAAADFITTVLYDGMAGPEAGPRETSPRS